MVNKLLGDYLDGLEMDQQLNLRVRVLDRDFVGGERGVHGSSWTITKRLNFPHNQEIPRSLGGS